MKTRRTAQTGLCSLALFLFVTACGDRGSEQSTQPPRANPQSSSLRISTIQAPAAARDRLRIDPVTAHMVPEVVTAPGEVTLEDRKSVV